LFPTWSGEGAAQPPVALRSLADCGLSRMTRRGRSLVKVSIGQGRGSRSREPVFWAGTCTCLITSTPRSAA
jgi:hypothetical protein